MVPLTAAKAARYPVAYKLRSRLFRNQSCTCGDALMLDEPSGDLSPVPIDRLLNVIGQLRKPCNRLPFGRTFAVNDKRTAANQWRRDKTRVEETP
jgi:hypothetical protein